MPNDVFRAIDAVLVLGVDDKNAPEGAAADALVSQYGLSNAVGRLRGVTISVTSDVKPFYEIGRRYPTHLRSGVVQTNGSIQRAHINGALLRLLLGDGAVSPPGSANFVQPSFNIIATLQDSAHPDQQTKIIVFGAKFESWSYNIPADDFVMEAVTFQALRVAFEEA
ncbi:MAG TPA: hypothetical protein PLD20_07305 [Blastocatellia bacterium]|nr:hypothetical protein [Blastocatellia bacterium]HMV85937.1 hypothetical protein [Blastocatellia bacterium]HMX29556.1 hypothetical protein [Blastocatellia bacterium]HMY74300.1 hypothetical protein [Blastocatellia bacterium]HMZ17718.1 hypothetical protein [Blastocatellia bacterium]